MAKSKKAGSFSAHSHRLVIFVLLTAVVVLGSMLFQANSHANTDKLNYQEQLANSQCDTNGSPVINVIQRVTNDADSGQAGNYWALDNFSRHIQAYKEDNGSYCVLVDYNGTFNAQAGQKSPGNTGTLTGNENGTIHGGYRAVITGPLLATPLLSTKGAIGPTDYNCDLSGNCPGAFDWTTKYFNTSASNFTFSYLWWGWTYKNAQHVWVNSISGNSGDVM